nr:tetratricopeptide repeat protein [Bacteriovorax sp. HI3]
MSKDKLQLLSPLFLKYQADYEKNPRSRVFAPLAETYRKLGMTDKAMEILAQGIRFHPTYVMGYLGLAFCYSDLKQYNLAYNTLRPLVENNRDNIRLQKLFADVCLELGYKEEALDTYKYLLFINPRDKEVALQVSTLERSIEEQYRPVHQPIYIPESEFRNDNKKTEIDDHQLFDIDKLQSKPASSKADFDDWMALDLSRDQKTPSAVEDPYEFWNLKKGDTPLDLGSSAQEETPVEEKPETTKPTLLEKFEQVEIKTAPDLYVALDLDDEEEEESEQDEAGEVPLVTHTLVDLYCGQGHIEKALEVLEKILILNPKDEKTIQKIREIKSLMGPYTAEPVSTPVPVKKVPEIKIEIPIANKPHLEALKEISEEDGRRNLMDILDQQLGHEEMIEAEIIASDPIPDEIDQKIAQSEEQKRKIEEKLGQFLKKIQKRALDYQSRV